MLQATDLRRQMSRLCCDDVVLVILTRNIANESGEFLIDIGISKIIVCPLAFLGSMLSFFNEIVQ